MNKKELELLIEKYLAGESTKQEEKWLKEFFNSYKAGDEVWDTERLGDVAKFEESLYRRIRSETISTEKNFTSVEGSLIRKTLKIAATIIVILGLGLIIYQVQDVFIQSESIVSPVIGWNSKNTASGEKLTFRLSDGTVVKLNSGSKLTFPTAFGERKREVKLEGEAFFDVAKDTSRPFMIRTNSITTTVLGTSFNINAYPKFNQIVVAVITGKVKVENMLKVRPDKNPSIVYLNPTRKATYVKGENQLIESDFVSDQEVGWKQGIIYFKNASESDAIERLERWYGVDIQINNNKLKEWDLTASFDNQLLDAVLLSLSHTANFNYSIKNKKIIINYIKTK